MSSRFDDLRRQAELGEELKREFRRKGVTVVAVEQAMGLPSTVLNHYLLGSRPWVGGVEDFEARVMEGIAQAIIERERVA